MSDYNTGTVEMHIKAQADMAANSLKRLQTTIDKLAKSSANLNLAVNQSSSGMANNVDKTGKAISKTSKEVNTLDGFTKKLNKSFNSAFSIGRIYFMINYTKQMAAGFAGMIKSAIDFVETENLFTASLREGRTEAIKFQNTMSEAFSLGIPQLMRAQAIFNNILISIKGISSELAAKTSAALTKMAIDISSLYNVSVEAAITKLEAAMTGQVRPIRSSTGMDITQNTLQQYLGEMGIYDRTIRQMSQIEKRLITIYAIQKQMAASGAMGDWANTINQPANQLKILQEQLKETGRMIGAAFLVSIGRVLPYINAFVMTIKALASVVATMFGYVAPDSSKLDRGLGLEVANEQAEDLEGNLKKIKSATLGIDELNIAQDNSDSGGNASGGSGVDQRILDSIQDYENKMSQVENKATQIRDKMLSWLGITKEINPETAEITYHLGKGNTNLNMILKTAKGIGIAFAGFTILKTVIGWGIGIASLFGETGLITKGMALLQPIFASLQPILAGVTTTTLAIGGAILWFAGVAIYAYNNNENFRKSVNALWIAFQGILNVIKPITDGISSLALSFLSFQIENVKTVVSVLYELSSGILKNGIDALTGSLKILALLLQGDLKGAFAQFEITSKQISENIDTTLGNIKGIIDNRFNEVKEQIKAKAEEWLTTVKTEIPKIPGKIKEFFDTLPNDIYYILGRVVGKLIVWQTDMNNKAKEVVTQIVGGIVIFFSELPDKIKAELDKVVTKLGEWKKTYETWITDNKGDFGKMFASLGNAMVNGLFKSIHDGFAKVRSFIQSFLDGINSVTSEAGLPPLKLPELAEYKPIQLLASGGFPDVGQMFIAREAGAEMVGNIGGKTAVVNNDQIVTSVAKGVYDAMLSAMKSGNFASPVIIDGREIFTVVENQRNKRGQSPIGGAFANA